jgi:O-antigen/teichoic acid export membrane protein
VIKRKLKEVKNNHVLYRFFKGAFWSLAGNVVVKGLALLASIFVARFLGKVEFGGLAIIKTTLSVFSLFATLGLGFTVTKFIADRRKNNFIEVPHIMAAAKRIITISGAVLGLLIIVFANPIASYILISEELTSPLRISGAYLFLNTLNVYQIGVLGGLEAYKKMAKANFVLGVISFPTVIIGAYSYGLTGVFVAMLFNLVINWYLFEAIIRKEILLLNVSINVKPQRKYINELLNFSYPLALSEGIYSLTNWIILYLLLIKTNYGEVGLFNSANHWVQMILFLPASLSNVLLSFLSNQTNDLKNYINILKINISLNLLITVSLSIIIAVLAPFIFQFYGQSFEEGGTILALLVFASVPMCMINVFEQVLISKSKTRLVFIFKIMRQSILLSLALILLIIESRALSLAKAWVLGYLIALILMLVYMSKKRLLEFRSVKN